MLINGNEIAEQIKQELKQTLSALSASLRKPCLAVIIVGDNPASKIYVAKKAKACEEIGMLSLTTNLDKTISEQALIDEIHALNDNDKVDGILLQLPLPHPIDPLKIIRKISPSKDVDGLHPLNVGKLFTGDPNGFVPCTPLGIKELLLRSNIEIAGKHVLILGRSNLVGKPLAGLLMQNTTGGNATVTVAHSHTKQIKQLCGSADIIIAAMGQPRFVTREMVREGTVVIDVGINKIPADNPQGYALVGDVDFDHVKDKCAYITPVPGGVGPMTIAMLLRNTFKSFYSDLLSSQSKATKMGGTAKSVISDTPTLPGA